MSSNSPSNSRYAPKYNEICISSTNEQIPLNVLSNYFQQFGNIKRLNAASSTGGFVFMAYESPSNVDQCMAARPHYYNGRLLYIKRALPTDDEHPRERFESTRELMIVVDFEEDIYQNKQFLVDLQKHFSLYGQIHACEYRDEENFSYIFIEFSNYDDVDRIILDKPHTYHDQPLHVMKHIKSNIDLMNIKYAAKNPPKRVLKESMGNSSRAKNMFEKEITKEPINESDLEREVFRLQNIISRITEDFDVQRRDLDDQCTEQLKKIKENVDRTRQLQQDLERDCATLSNEYESTKTEHDALNEHYLNVELESFEISSYYEQILAEEQAKTVQLEAKYQEKLRTKSGKSSSSFQSLSKSHPHSPFTN